MRDVLLRRCTSIVTALAGGVVLLCSAVATAQTEKVIYAFDQTHGSAPNSGLTADKAGNLYGTTNSGGSANCGVAFELSPNPAGPWTETVLYNFQGCEYGPTPYGTMSIDAHGNLFGAAEAVFESKGAVFELIKGEDGEWREKDLHEFGYNEGAPAPDLALDSAGNVYGVTLQDYVTPQGEVFELSPQANGSWSEKILYQFPSPDGDGYPQGGPILDSQGNLYGTVGNGNVGRRGAIYELSPTSSGPWTLTTLNNGAYPENRLTFDARGNLYAITAAIESGEVLQYVNSGGTWTQTVLHLFKGGSDGNRPVGSVVFDASGNLYGATVQGGNGCNGSLCGLIYKLTPSTNGGAWKETIIHPFESAEDGSEPFEGPFIDSSDRLFGTTYTGGSRYGYGTVYEIVP